MGKLYLSKNFYPTSSVKPVVLFVLLALVGMPARPASDSCAKGNLELNDDLATTLDGTIAIDVLANDERPRGLALTVQIVSTTCSGSVIVDLDAIVYDPSTPLTSSCKVHYRAYDNRPGSGSNLLATSAHVTISPNGYLFRDGFESNSTKHWSSCEGCSGALNALRITR